jgi:hypothetical protein
MRNSSTRVSTDGASDRRKGSEGFDATLSRLNIGEVSGPGSMNALRILDPGLIHLLHIHRVGSIQERIGLGG